MRSLIMLALTSFLLTCADIPYQERSKKPLLEASPSPKQEELTLLNDSWPKLWISANPSIKSAAMDSSDIGSMTLLDLATYDMREEHREGFVFMHGIIQNNEEESVEVLFNILAPSIYLSTQWLEPLPGKGCQLKDLEKGKRHIGQKYDYDSGDYYYRVFDYDLEKDIVGPELKSDDTSGLSWLKLGPKKPYLVKWYAKPKFTETVTVLKKGKLPDADNCKSAELKQFYELCENSNNFDFHLLNECNRTGNFFIRVFDGWIDGSLISVIAQKVGNTNSKDRKVIDIELNRPTRILGFEDSEQD